MDKAKSVAAGNKNWKALGFLLLYLCCVLYITLLSRNGSPVRIFRTDLLSSYRIWFAGDAGKRKSIFQNIVLFVPLGFFLSGVMSLRFGKGRFLITVLLGFAVSLLIETVQYYTGRGWFDVDDLVNNTLGAAIGRGLFFAAEQIARKKKTGRVACDVLSVFLILAGLFGCFRMAKIVGNTPKIVELDFEKDGIPKPEIPDDGFFAGAELKAYSEEYDTYVFQKGDRLIWLIGYAIEPTTEIIYHISTDEPGKLPENRVQYGFDNRGFRSESENELESIGRYRVYEKEIPTEYQVSYVVVGFNPGEGVVWAQAFRVEQDHSEMNP